MGEPEVGNPRCKGTECLVLKYLLCRHGCDGKSIAAPSLFLQVQPANLLHLYAFIRFWSDAEVVQNPKRSCMVVWTEVQF